MSRAPHMGRVEHNYLPGQYDEMGEYPINHNYLPQQFADYQDILDAIGEVAKQGDYTLGRAVDAFEDDISRITGSRFAIGLGSGTDALFLSLKAAGVGPDDEVVTTPYTFFATVGAIATAGATPVFVDIRDDYNIDPGRIKDAVTERTKAILPVHWSGRPCRMDPILDVAARHGLVIVEDACHAMMATYKGRMAGTFGLTGCFSLHPLKNLNVWGDGGYLVTDSEEIHEKIVLLRNHGLVNRNECRAFAYNSRLDSIQAVVANHLLKKLDFITESRIAHASRFDELLAEVPEITLPPRADDVREVFHLYVVRAQRRNELQAFLQSSGVDAKVHYPIPMHLQPAAQHLGYSRGSFPICEAVCDSVLSLPVHEFITDDQIQCVVDRIKEFYAKHPIR